MNTDTNIQTHRQQCKQHTRAGITFWCSPSPVRECGGDRGRAKPPTRWVKPPSKKKKKKKKKTNIGLGYNY